MRILAYPIALLILLLIALAALSGCTTVALEIGAGYDTHLDRGTNPRNYTSIRGELEGCFNTKGTCITHFTHMSSYFTGWPFGEGSEDLTNHWGFAYRYPLWQAR